MNKAFNYMFKDPGYEKKATTYFILCLIAMALSMSPELANITTGNINISSLPDTSKTSFTFLPLIANIFFILLAGYHLTCVQAIAKQGQNIVLPFFNIKTAFITGLKNLVANILFVIVTILIFMPLVILGKVVGTILCVILGLFLGYIFNALMWIFANERKFTSYLAWKKAVKLIGQNKGNYFNKFLLTILLSIVGAFVTMLFSLLFNFLIGNAYIAWLATSIECAVVASYIAFVGMYLIGKSIEYDKV